MKRELGEELQEGMTNLDPKNHNSVQYTNLGKTLLYLLQTDN